MNLEVKIKLFLYRHHSIFALLNQIALTLSFISSYIILGWKFAAYHLLSGQGICHLLRWIFLKQGLKKKEMTCLLNFGLECHG